MQKCCDNQKIDGLLNDGEKIINLGHHEGIKDKPADEKQDVEVKLILTVKIQNFLFGDLIHRVQSYLQMLLAVTRKAEVSAIDLRRKSSIGRFKWLFWKMVGRPEQATIKEKVDQKIS